MSANEENTALHLKLIEYATTSCRLLFIEDPEILADFDSNNSDNELSTLELNAVLLNDILPKVHAYELTETVKNRLKLLDLHPGFRKTDQGYQYESKCNAAPFALKVHCDFNLMERMPQLLSTLPNCRFNEDFQSDATTKQNDSHTMLVDENAASFATPRFPLDLKLSSLLSAMLSTDMELSCSQMLSVPEIHERLRRAKQNFEDTGNCLPFRTDLQQMLDYVATFEQLKKSLCRLMSHQ